MHRSLRHAAATTAVLASCLLPALATADTADSRMRYSLDRTAATRVVVDKSDRRLTLLLTDGRSKQFSIALGGDPIGHKWRRGDSRTPEGEYLIDYKNLDSEFYLSVRISYPNDADRADAERLGVHPGGQVMIHGYPNDAKPPYDEYRGKDWTDGCIAVSNSAMQEIWLAVRENTPITIRP